MSLRSPGPGAKFDEEDDGTTPTRKTNCLTVGKSNRYMPPLHIKRRIVTMHNNGRDFDRHGAHDPCKQMLLLSICATQNCEDLGEPR